jgi:hypothetical protein
MRKDFKMKERKTFHVTLINNSDTDDGREDVLVRKKK